MRNFIKCNKNYAGNRYDIRYSISGETEKAVKIEKTKTHKRSGKEFNETIWLPKSQSQIIDGFVFFADFLADKFSTYERHTFNGSWTKKEDAPTNEMFVNNPELFDVIEK